MWRGVVLLGVLACWLCGCLDKFTRESAPAPASMSQQGETGLSSDNPPTPSLFRMNFDIGQPSE
jgi:hypothetical protein